MEQATRRLQNSGEHSYFRAPAHVNVCSALRLRGRDFRLLRPGQGWVGRLAQGWSWNRRLLRWKERVPKGMAGRFRTQFIQYVVAQGGTSLGYIASVQSI